MKLLLNTWQRVMLGFVIRRLRGDVGFIQVALRLLETLDLSPGEKQTVGYRERPTGPEWDNASLLFPIKITESDQILFLRSAVTQFKEWPVANSQDVLYLVDQIQEKDSPDSVTFSRERD